VLLDFTGVLGVPCCHYISRPWGVGRSRYGGHDGAEEGGWGCSRGGLSLIGSSGVRRSHEQALNPEQGVEAHHRKQGGSGSPMRAVVSHAAGGSTRSAEQRCLWDGRLSASPPHAAFCDHHHNMVTIMRIVINNGLLASGSSGRCRGRPLGHPAADGGGGGNPCCAAARPVAAHLTYHLDTSAVAALVVTLLVRPSWYCA
jgi:hypothetical protein